MKVLLISMPDSVSAADNLVEFPNTGLCSVAGNLADHDVRVMDLVACRRRIKKTLVEQLNAFRPDLVGLSAMTFQYGSALKVAQIVQEWQSDVPIALGGYHASLCYREIALSPSPVCLTSSSVVKGSWHLAGCVKPLKKGTGLFKISTIFLLKRTKRSFTTP